MARYQYNGGPGWVLDGKVVAPGATVTLSEDAARQMLANGHPLVPLDKNAPAAVQTSASDLATAAEVALAQAQQDAAAAKEAAKQ